jgi:hypothetical protein
VAVRDGAVTLTGHVPSYAEKLAAARAAERVYGVKAVANDLKVQFSRAPRDDSDIARAIAHIVDAQHVKVEVTDHTAKLYGHVHSMREASAAADGAGPGAAAARSAAGGAGCAPVCPPPARARAGPAG